MEQQNDVSIESFDLLRYWRILVRRRWSIYLAVSAVFLVALVGSFLSTPMYKGTATLQISRQGPDILDVRDVARTDFGWSAYDDFYQTQYTILASKPVARLAVERLELASHPAFEASEARPSLLSRLKAMLPRKERVLPPGDPLDGVVGRVRGALEISPMRNSHLVRVSWVDADPELAADVANAVAEAYIQFSLASRYTTTNQAREFLVNQTGLLKREIEDIENRLQEYAEAKKIFSIDESNNLTLQALQDISKQRTAAQTALARSEAAYRSTRETVPEAMPQVLNSSLIGQLRAEYATYEAEYTQKAKIFKDDWPGLQTLKSKLDQAQERLHIETARIVEQVRASTEAEYRQALVQVDRLDRLLGRYEESARRLKRDAVEYNSLQSEVKKKRESLDSLLRRQNEMSLSTRLKDLDTTSSNITIMERAQPARAAFSPNTKVNLLMGLLVGLALGTVLALFLDHIDNTISTTADLERLLSIPVLAAIPRHGNGNAPLANMRRGSPTERTETIYLIADRESQTAVAEAYRALRTSILLSNPGQPPRKIALTSACPEEGKTATTLNLGVVLAQLGRRVLLVDADLRRPRLHQAFEIRNACGVSTFLAGQEQDAGRLIQSTDVAGLDVMPSGPIPPNPSELLNSPIFSKMSSDLLEQGYDHILFDTPPVLSVSDPVIVASIADTGILVARAGRTPRQSVRLAADRLVLAGGGTFGVVLNDVDARHGGGAYYASFDEYRYEPADATTDTSKRASGGS